MNPKNMSLEDYTEYVTSTVGFMEMWQHCYYALLSNPAHSEKQMEDLHELSWKHAKELKRAARHYLESQEVI
jgi:hypothetical protein